MITLDWMIDCLIFYGFPWNFSYLIFSIFLLHKQRFHMSEKLIFINLFLMNGGYVLLQYLFLWLIAYDAIHIFSCFVLVVMEA